MRLIDHLRVPYVLKAETVELDDGTWVRRISYPELPDCVVEAAVVEEALSQLERKRIETIVRMAREGRSPPALRPPLKDSDPGWIAKQVGVADEDISLIERDGATVAPT